MQPKKGRQAGRANEQSMYWDHRPILYRQLKSLLPSIEMMAKLTADDLELRLAKNTEIDSFML